MDWTGNVENIEWSSSDGFLATTLVVWLLAVFVRTFKYNKISQNIYSTEIASLYDPLCSLHGVKLP